MWQKPSNNQMGGPGSSFADPIVIVLSCHKKRKRKEWSSLGRNIARRKEMETLKVFVNDYFLRKSDLAIRKRLDMERREIPLNSVLPSPHLICPSHITWPYLTSSQESPAPVSLHSKGPNPVTYIEVPSSPSLYWLFCLYGPRKKSLLHLAVTTDISII